MGGSLFGFYELGIHAFELLYMVLFAVTLIVTLRGIYGPTVACLASLFTVGSYYLIVNAWWMTTLEALINFPVFIVLMSLARIGEPSSDTRWWLLLAGLASGVVFVCKPILFLVPGALWLTFFVVNKHVGRSLMAWILFLGGSALPFITILAWFSLHGASSFLFQTVFLTPLEIGRSVDAWSRLPILKTSVKWFVQNLAPLIFLASIGIYGIVRNPNGSARESVKSEIGRFLSLGSVVWLFTGIAAILLQVNSWWMSHWPLLLCPLGILSALTVNAMIRQLKPAGGALPLGVICIALALSYPLGKESLNSIGAFRLGLDALRPAKRLAYQTSLVPWYEMQYADSTFLARPDALPGPIFVWGNPIVYFFFPEHVRASAIMAPPMVMTEELYTRLANDLEREKPVYIYLKYWPNEKEFLRNSRLSGFLTERYEVAQQSKLGTWYRRKI